MTKPTIFAILLALPLAAGCDPNEPADEAGEVAEEAAEERAEAAGEDPLTEHIRGEVAEERAELGHDVNAADPGTDQDNAGHTAAERLDAVEDGEAEETGY